MPICINCNERFPCHIKLENGKIIDTGHRKYCLKCNPTGARLFWRGKKVEKREDGKRVLYNKEYKCTLCQKIFKQKTRNLVCSGCRGKITRHENRDKAISLLGGKCYVCGYNKCIEAYDFHHIDEKEKKFVLARGWEKNWNIIKVEVEKCSLLCSNCHRELHAGLFSLLLRKSNMDLGKPISRSEVIERSTQILIEAESERLKFAEEQSKIGADYTIDISSSDNEELKNIIKNLNNQITQLSNHYL